MATKSRFSADSHGTLTEKSDIDWTTKPSGPEGNFKGDIEVSSKLPSKAELDKAAKLPILDVNGKRQPFGNLFNDESAFQKHLIVFVRHFFCGQCQEYIRTLVESLPTASLPSSVSITIIGCGQPDLITMYKDATNCPFPIYADPTRKLYDILGMTRTLSLGPKSPKYVRQSIWKIIISSFMQEMRSGKNMLKGGDFWQVGGEFIIESGEVAWCRRMRNTRDHTEMPEIKRLLGVELEPEDKEDKEDQRHVFKQRWSTSLGRRLSTKRQSWRTSLGFPGADYNEANVMDKLREDAEREEKEIKQGTKTGSSDRAINANADVGSDEVKEGVVAA